MLSYKIDNILNVCNKQCMEENTPKDSQKIINSMSFVIIRKNASQA